MACGEHAAIVEYASVLSFSITMTISLLNLLKVWVEQLFAARMASVPVDASVVLVWEMGAGKLPLDRPSGAARPRNWSITRR